MPPPVDYIRLSQSLLYAVRTGEEGVPGLMAQLAAAAEGELQAQLTGEDHKKAFWLNLYNTWVQWLLQQDPAKYKNRNAFFTDKQIQVAGHRLSLDDIEHGLLRRSTFKWSLGYLRNPLPSRFEKCFRLQRLDPRIHFALNCGARSCPPIAYYRPEDIDRQLDLAQKSYLRAEVTRGQDGNKVYLPAILGWFRGDFGGKRGLRALLQREGLLRGSGTAQLHFKPYDWTLFLNNYTNETP